MFRRSRLYIYCRYRCMNQPGEGHFRKWRPRGQKQRKSYVYSCHHRWKMSSITNSTVTANSTQLLYKPPGGMSRVKVVIYKHNLGYPYTGRFSYKGSNVFFSPFPAHFPVGAALPFLDFGPTSIRLSNNYIDRTSSAWNLSWRKLRCNQWPIAIFLTIFLDW